MWFTPRAPRCGQSWLGLFCLLTVAACTATAPKATPLPTVEVQDDNEDAQVLDSSGDFSPAQDLAVGPTADAAADLGAGDLVDATDVSDTGGDVAEDILETSIDLCTSTTTCEDGNPCTDDLCNPSQGCSNTANQAECDDGDACTLGDHCQGSVCLAGALTLCDDGKVCTDDSCLKTKGCLHVVNALPCDDGQVCSTGDVCVAGACQATGTVSCDDNNVCTLDNCVPGQGCQNTAAAGPCSDGNACTSPDVCNNGACASGGPLSCKDNTPCTDDSCDKGIGCVHLPNTATCEDGIDCTGYDNCVGGVCVAGKPILFDATYGDKGTDFPAVGPLANGNYVIAGDTNVQTAGGWDLQVQGLNPGGDPLWTTTLGGAQDDAAHALAPVGTYATQGWIVAGETRSKGAGGADAWLLAIDPKGKLLWDSTFGGAGDDFAYSVVQNGDGWAAAGWTASNSAGANDFWLLRTDAAGVLQWQKSFGGANDERARAVVSVADGGLALAGSTLAADPTATADAWLVRTDAQGSLLWSQTYGGAGDERANGLVALADGFALFGSQIAAGSTNADYWLVRTDLGGNVLWTKTFGGAGQDVGLGLVAMPYPGFALVGTTTSKGAGGSDGWLVRTDGDGELLWDYAYGGAKDDHLTGIGLVDGGPLAMVGDTLSKGAPAGDTKAQRWLLRVDTYGNQGCMQSGACVTKGLANCDDKNVCTVDSCAPKSGCTHKPLAQGTPCATVEACTVLQICAYGACQPGVDKYFDYHLGQAKDEVSMGLASVGPNYVLAGSTTALGQGGKDGRVLWVDVGGDTLGEHQYGGAKDDWFNAVVGRSDGSVDLFGQTSSQGAGAADAWILRVDAQGAVLAEKTLGTVGDDLLRAASAWPDGSVVAVGETAGDTCSQALAMRWSDTATVQWQVILGNDCQRLRGVAAEASSGGAYVVGDAGATNPKPSAWLAKIDGGGNLLWSKAFAGARSLAATIASPGGGSASVGQSEINAGDSDWWLLRTDAQGTVLWSRTYPADGVDRGMAIALAANGNMLLAGDMAATAQSSSMAVRSVDALGNPLWLHEKAPKLAGSGPEPLSAGLVLADGGLLATGPVHTAATGLDMRLLRLDPFGHDSCATSGVCVAKTSSTCDDFNPCTADVCDTGQNCQHIALADWSPCGNGAVCDGQGLCAEAKTLKGKVLIPAGSFQMGCVGGDGQCKADELPAHSVSLASFYLDIQEVTVQQYAACVQAGACVAPAVQAQGTWQVAGAEKEPINAVSWAQAQAYCVWQGGQLPTEAQWERAARGGKEGQIVPWAAGLSCSVAVFDDGPATAGQGCDGLGLQVVGSKAAAANAYGLQDMIGNVAEMTADWYGASAYVGAESVDPMGPAAGTAKVARGGGFLDSADSGYLRLSSRRSLDISALAAVDVGWRCARAYP